MDLIQTTIRPSIVRCGQPAIRTCNKQSGAIPDKYQIQPIVYTKDSQVCWIRLVTCSKSTTTVMDRIHIIIHIDTKYIYSITYTTYI